ncbi:hypothetical protein ABZT45_25475 [Streptomyces sp. NPDC005356]|uniref:hypothetical protein n=1 Tax=Streptomyces sp. NPDC005356 TaxID=3157167 RepID=UPI0033B386D3
MRFPQIAAHPSRSVGTWLPQMMRAEGYGLFSSVSSLMVINAGGIVGLLIAGRTADKFGAVRVLAIWFVLTAAGAMLLRSHLPLGVTYAVVAVTGIWLFGAQVMVYAATNTVYRDSGRAAGARLGHRRRPYRSRRRPLADRSTRRERQPELGHHLRPRRAGGRGGHRPCAARPADRPQRLPGDGSCPATASAAAPDA